MKRILLAASLSFSSLYSTPSSAYMVPIIAYLLSGCDSSSSSSQNSSQSSSSTDSSASSSSAVVQNYKIADTDQSKCFDSYSGSDVTCNANGYDADYDGNQPSYTVNGDVVTDNVTGLIWTQSTDLDGDDVTTDAGDKLTQSEAIDYCADLSLGGYNDWRLPDIKTLYSLILFSGVDASSYTGSDTSSLTPFLSSSFSRAFGDQSVGERIIDAQYATTSNYVYYVFDHQEAMFGVNFVDGRIKGYPLDKTFYVLCVRGNEDYGVNDFTNNGDATVTDNATGLMWQQNDQQSSDFEDAIGLCEEASTAGHEDWRLPNVKELHSILDYSRSPDTTNSAAIDPIFNATSFTNEEGEIDWGYYWSSTTHEDTRNGANGSYVAFGRGLGTMHNTILDVHGAGTQRSNAKMSFSTQYSTATDAQGETYYYFGPQGDIVRLANMVRCVRDADAKTTASSSSSSSASSVATKGVVFNSEGVSEGNVLFGTMGSTTTRLINTDGDTVQSWQSSYPLGNAAYLTSDNHLLRSSNLSEAGDTFSASGATGGLIEEYDTAGDVLWTYQYYGDTYALHHDFKQIDDNTIIALSWEVRAYNNQDYWDEKILFINKDTQNVTWSWSAMDHVNPSGNKSDYFHFNSIDSQNGTLLVSSRSLSELWLIDKANGAITKRYSGDLESQHDAGFLDNGNILVFNNGTTLSKVEEIDTDSWSVTWEYSDTFYSDHISGAQRLSNGNTLICSGTEGTFIEVDTNGDMVWKYVNPYSEQNPQGERIEVFKIRKYQAYM